MTRLGILLADGSATPLETLLVRELIRALPEARLTLFTGADTKKGSVSWAERLRRGADAWLARTTQQAEPPATLTNAAIEMVSLATQPEALLAARCDALIDLNAAIDAATLARVAPAVYQLWCDRQRDTLRFGGLVTDARQSRYSITWTVRRSDRMPPRIIAQSSLAWIPSTVTYNQRCAAGRAIALLLRILGAHDRACDGIEWHERDAPAQPTVTASLGSGARTIGEAIKRRLHRVWSRPEVWFIGYRTAADRTTRFRRWGSNRHGWVADPCAFRHNDTNYVFFEDYQYNARRGIISWSALQPDGLLTRPQVALAREYHLSYPFVFEHDRQVYMIPETAQNQTIELYRAIEFPSHWELHCTLLKDVNAVDATLHFEDDRWWMFVNIGEYGSSTWDELFLFISERLEGPWRPHPRNPVKCDPASSRPAGPLFRRNGQLVRPAQDCSRIYGGGINLCAIDALSETTFREHVIETIGPECLLGVQGVHTFSASDGLEVIDGKWARRPIWWSGYPR